MASFQHVDAPPRFLRDPAMRNVGRGEYVYSETVRDTYARQADYAAAPGAEANPASLGRLMSWVGALLSVALVLGIAIWAWQLTMRDVSGVPVIRALEGPMRTVPDDPGGAQAPHQGLSVNRIAEGAEATPAPDRVVLAPPPVNLEALDIATSGENAPPETAELIDQLLQRPEANDAAAPTQEAGAPQVSQNALADSADILAPRDGGVIPASVPGVSRSVRPALRPAELQTTTVNLTSSTAEADPAAQAGAAETVAADGVTELSAAQVPVGTRLVQLGAFDSAAIARSEWARLAGRYPDFFAGRARIVQQASSGGQQFFRLRANGFETLDESRRFCAAMVARGAACIPVTIR